jgi:hypothetical protein
MTLLRRPVLIIIGLVVVVGGGFGYYWTQLLPASQVEVRVGQAKPNPCTDVYTPLFIAVVNHSRRTVTKVGYRLIAKRPGDSTNLAEGDAIRQFDGVTPSGGGLGYCQPVPNLTERFLSWQTLEWSAEIVSVSFE